MAEKIRSAARRSAWYNSDGDEVRTYNFFGRLNPNYHHANDEENQNRLAPTASASPIEDRRRDNPNGFGPGPSPAKSATFAGAASSSNPTSSSEKADATSTEKASEEDGNAAPQPVDITSGPTDRSVGSEGGTRKRKIRKFFPPFSKKDESAEPEDVPRSNTQKSGSPRPKITVMSQLRVVFGSWINLLLVFVPVGIALNYVHINKIVVFVINFIAIIPLAAMLSYATEELAMYIGEVLGGLLNATFGNAVELIVSIIALTQHKVLIVQTSLIGSMLSNLLLVMGMCFFFGGLRRQEQNFNITVAQTAASLLALAIGSLIIPTAFTLFSGKPTTSRGVTALSRGTSVLLLIVYACYLIFQLHTHVEIYNAPSEKTPKKSSGRKESGDASKGIATIGAATGAAMAGGQVNQENLVQEIPEEPQVPNLTRVGALTTLAVSTVFIALCAEFMVDAIGAVSEHVSQEFIGLILLPIVGNAAEHATAVTVAIKDKMDLAIGVAVGSSLQIALLVLPLAVMLNWWGVGKPSDLNLDFDGFQVSVLFISIILVNYLIQDGKSHWLEGVLLQVAYLIIAISAWFYPANGDVVG